MKKICFNSKIYLAVVLALFVMVYPLNAQETLEEQDELITNIFNYGMLINSQTTEITPKGTFELRIQHRFGELDLNDFGNSVVQEFLGFDGSANIRFGFVYSPSHKLQLGIGRTKINKTIDLESKYRLMRQKEVGGPISITLYFNTAISTIDFPEVGPNEFFVDFETPFENKNSHRFTYNTQILVSKKFGEKLSFEMNPTFVYQNLVTPGYKNLTIATSVGCRFRTGITSSILFEYAAKFNNRKDNYKNPISLGYEIGTSGHAFQIIIATTNQIIEQSLYTSKTLDYTDGKLLIGFNIKRTFWNGNN